ncbi:MAG: hypothetical protein Q7R70_00815 [Candidatus Diapherotrites archaeon]|nr:hypothetical protein [Candidatus Diapherotrites archaeon]
MPVNRLRNKTIRKATRTVNTGFVLRNAGKGSAFAGLGAGTMAMLEKRNPVPLAIAGGAGVGTGLLLNKIAGRIEGKIAARLVGKPRAAALIAQNAKDLALKTMLETLSKIDYRKVSKTQKEALRKLLLGTADATETNVAIRILKKHLPQ